MRRAAALAAASVMLLAGLATAHTASHPHAPMPAVAVCAFDGGGLAVAGSVTRTRDGRLWRCTDDGYLVPFHGRIPASR